MPRPHIVVSRAGQRQVGELATLWIESALAAGMTHDLAARTAGTARVADALRRPGTAAYLATLDGRPLGFAVVNERQHGLLEPPALALDELFVIPEGRRQGVAGQLLAAVARHAESTGHDLVFANVATTDKVGNRYFARLGFGQQATRRVVPTTVLRRKLSAEDAEARDVLLGRRRTIRARAVRQSGATPARGLVLRRPAAG
ncbi:MAG: GNAT family N-acetyltransferase [Dermatophilaceae bacterium]